MIMDSKLVESLSRHVGLLVGCREQFSASSDALGAQALRFLSGIHASQAEKSGVSVDF